MLRKRSRSVQKDQNKGHLMPDSVSESNFQSEVLGQKYKNSSFFSVPGIFVGLSTKGSYDSDSSWSPTSPLDYRVFSNLGNPFRFSRSCPNGPQKSWDCGKVGLGIVDSLNDETKLGISEGRNILFGSHRKINIPSLDESDVAFRTGEIQLEPNQFHKIGSSSLNSDKSESHPTGLTYYNPDLSLQYIRSDKKTTRSSSPLMGGSNDVDIFLGMQTNSLPISIGSGDGLTGSLSASEIELSEDYTCVISHGPNPRTTHIFCDCILECHTNELENCTKRNGSPRVIKSPEGSALYATDDFLSFCYFCKNKMVEGKDIYMNRGEKSFCGCHSREILADEELEKPMNNSSNSSPRSTYCEEIFSTGTVIST